MFLTKLHITIIWTLSFSSTSLCHHNSSESFPIILDEIGEYKARNLRPPPPYRISPYPTWSFALSFGHSSVYLTGYQWCLGQGTGIAMSRAWFCGHWIFLCERKETKKHRHCLYFQRVLWLYHALRCIFWKNLKRSTLVWNLSAL